MTLNLTEGVTRLFARYPFTTTFLFLALVVGVLAFVIGLFGYSMTLPFTYEAFDRQYPYLLLTMIFGAFVGAAEIASRYRDEPFRSIISAPGRTYMAFNALISLAAFCLLARYPRFFGFEAGLEDYLIMSVVAGFGAMVVMRSKLFNFKNDKDDSTISVGPDAVINIFLTSVDRNIDRYRSFDRQALVYQEATKIKRPADAPAFINTFLASYQNLSEEDKREFSGIIESVRAKTDLTDELKLMAISFGFLKISGDTNYKALMDLLSKHQEMGQPVPPPLDAGKGAETPQSGS